MKSLLFSKPFKENSLLDKNEHTNKASNVLSDGDLLSIQSDQTIRDRVEPTLKIFNCIFIHINPSTPRFYSLPKIYKDACPTRPVVSYV